MYLRGGEWDGRQLISRSWAETAQVPLSVDDESGTYYSWQWWVTGDDYGTYWASGYEGQQISVVPALDALVLRFGHTPEERYPVMYEWRTRVLKVLEGLGAFVVEAEVRSAKERAKTKSLGRGHRRRRAATIDDREDQRDLGAERLGDVARFEQTRTARDGIFGNHDAVAGAAALPRCARRAP